MKKINDITYLYIFLLMSCLLWIIKRKDYFVILILLIIIVMIIKNQVNKKEILIISILIILFFIEILFVPNWYNQKYFVSKLENDTIFFIGRDKLFKWINTNYNDEVSSFVKLLLFNEKTPFIYKFYNNIVDINVVHLFTISGMHLNIINWIILKIFKNKKFKYSNKVFYLIFLLGYGYFLQYSISFLRIFFTSCLSFFFNQKKSFYISGIINLFLFVNIGFNFGFILSYGSILVIIAILNFQINKFWKFIFINIFCNLFTVWFNLLMNNKINILSTLYGILLSPLVTLLYIWFLFTIWIIPLAPIHENLILIITTIINELTKIKTILYFNKICIYPIYVSYMVYVFVWIKKPKQPLLPLLEGKTHNPQ